ncbi:hypothetical protein NIGALANA_43 [Bacillus phage Nigalana]|uniref:hypothetical protein n=1 Tax=Bacillus phage Nigalana TaxID=1805951 RepID=UPI0007A7762A|nr:hypothetical protein BI005_gp043 [Bacillus phage Nigalana]AMW61197.1 hypothetical protein NIGALANA_43 [Bacillus phage Nigalana]
MIREYDRIYLEDAGYKYEGLIGVVEENPYSKQVWIKFPNHESSVVMPLNKVKLLDRPFLSFFDAIRIAEEDDVLVCEYAGYQNIDCTDKYAFVWEDSREAVKLVGEFIGMKWKIAIDN